MAGAPTHPADSGIRRMRLALLLGCCALLLGGCGESDGGAHHPVVPPADRYEANSSPESVWRNLVRSYSDRNFEHFDPLFDCLLFGFETVEPGSAVDDTLNCVEVKSAVQRAFVDPGLESMVIRSGIQLVGLASEEDHLPFPAADVVKFTLLLHVEVHVESDTGEPIEYLVDGDQLEVYLRQYPLELASDGRPTWKFVYWRGPELLGLVGISPLL